jgi:molybdate transport system ATP-binding protein
MIDLRLEKALDAPRGKMNLVFEEQIEPGNFVAITGKSGSGKTSILRMIAGLLQADDGHIRLSNDVWYDQKNKIYKTPQKRRIAYLFQDYALFPTMTVRQNLEYALEPKQGKEVVEELLQTVELAQMADRKPEKLSGGQQQRVALARALVRKPDILLLDEPLSALDQEMRSTMQDYILQLHKRYKPTTILISHDISEILKLADELIVLEEGKVIKRGAPIEIISSAKLGGKFTFTGKVIAIEQQEFLYILTILIGRELVKVIADQEELEDLVIGDKVVVSSKAFNPIVERIR